MIVSEATYLMQIFASAFLAILFLQSGIDKVRDRGGDFEWPKGHFAKSPPAGIVTALLICITILEVAAGALSAVGCLLIIVLKDSTIAFYGAILSAAAITALFLGGESRRITPVQRCSFRTFCSRWLRFICSHNRKLVRLF
jgi:uncharacterized membrane protein YphA (DoxX/SURF4 family)